jgi:hypothetical protein
MEGARRFQDRSADARSARRVDVTNSALFD